VQLGKALRVFTIAGEKYVMIGQGWGMDNGQWSECSATMQRLYTLEQWGGRPAGEDSKFNYEGGQIVETPEGRMVVARDGPMAVILDIEWKEKCSRIVHEESPTDAQPMVAKPSKKVKPAKRGRQVVVSKAAARAAGTPSAKSKRVKLPACFAAGKILKFKPDGSVGESLGAGEGGVRVRMAGGHESIWRGTDIVGTTPAEAAAFRKALPKWDFVSTFPPILPAVLKDAHAMRALGADDFDLEPTSSQWLKNAHKGWAEELVGRRRELVNIDIILRTNVNPRTERKLTTKQRAEVEHDRAKTAADQEDLFDYYAGYFGDEAADAFRAFIEKGVVG
jgi:hypothetical protein